MPDQIIDAAMARALHEDVRRAHPLVAWVVWRDHPEHPGCFIAQLVAASPLPYALKADTLAGVQEQLPPGLTRTERQPSQPLEVVEIWFAG